MLLIVCNSQFQGPDKDKGDYVVLLLFRLKYIKIRRTDYCMVSIGYRRSRKSILLLLLHQRCNKRRAHENQ